jgi:hypothetical protein
MIVLNDYSDAINLPDDKPWRLVVASIAPTSKNPQERFAVFAHIPGESQFLIKHVESLEEGGRLIATMTTIIEQGESRLIAVSLLRYRTEMYP